jgi:ketosteroid isomerase-like protein
MDAMLNPAACVRRIQQAINQHDLDTLTDCFEPDYQSEFPAHPLRAFRGHAALRANWTRIFSTVPDLQAELLRCLTDDETAWAEWDWRGTGADGQPFAMRGVTLQGVRAGRVAWARLYMEPVRDDDHALPGMPAGRPS